MVTLFQVSKLFRMIKMYTTNYSFEAIFNFGHEQKIEGAKSGEYGWFLNIYAISDEMLLNFYCAKETNCLDIEN